MEAQAVYPFAPLVCRSAKAEEAVKGAIAFILTLDGFSWLCYVI